MAESKDVAEPELKNYHVKWWGGDQNMNCDDDEDETQPAAEFDLTVSQAYIAGLIMADVTSVGPTDWSTLITIRVDGIIMGIKYDEEPDEENNEEPNDEEVPVAAEQAELLAAEQVIQALPVHEEAANAIQAEHDGEEVPEAEHNGEEVPEAEEPEEPPHVEAVVHDDSDDWKFPMVPDGMLDLFITGEAGQVRDEGEGEPNETEYKALDLPEDHKQHYVMRIRSGESVNWILVKDLDVIRGYKHYIKLYAERQIAAGQPELPLSEFLSEIWHQGAPLNIPDFLASLK